MALLDSAVSVVHVLFAGAWAGGTLLMTLAVLPAAREGHLSGDGLSSVARRFSMLSMASVLALLASGGHMAGTRYTFGTLSGSGRGHLVLTMVALWLVLAGVLHVGTHRMTDELEDAGPQDAVEAGWPWYSVGAVVAVALLVVAGLL